MDTTAVRPDYVLCRHHWRLQRALPDQPTAIARCDYCGIEGQFSRPNLEHTPPATDVATSPSMPAIPNPDS